MIGYLSEAAGGLSKRGDGGVRFICQAGGFIPCFFEAEDAHISAFPGGGVLAGGLAEFFRRLCAVENVINDLESEAQVIAESG